MSAVREQTTRARNRLWLDLWFDVGCRLLTWLATAFAVLVLLSRLQGWAVPWLAVVGVTAAVVLMVSIIWSWRVRPSAALAAAALDEAAGLRERVSSSLYCESSDDPFARAVRADAETRAASLTVGRHLRFHLPHWAGPAGGALMLAALMFLVPDGLLRRAEAEATGREETRLAATRVEVKQRLEQVKKMAQTNPALADLKIDIDKLDTMPTGKMNKPSDVRQEALKKIDKLADAVRKKQTGDKYDRVSETKKMLRALKEPTGEKTPVQKLARNLATGDFKTAQETLKQMREHLATLKQDSDKEFAQKMEKQLEQLAGQLEMLAQQQQLKKKLQQAGLKKEDVERMLQRLTKEDLDQIRKQLEKSGMSQQQINQVCKQCQRQQGASQVMQQMSQAMSSAAQAAGAGQMGDAMAAMEQAGDQLSDLEMLEQEMNQLDSALASLQDAQNECGGQGQGGGQQGRGGMGKLGRGRGGLAPSQETATGFKIERGKVQTTKGRIVGQFLVDGEQVKGEADEEFVELITAAERVATDTVNRDRIPRQYQKAVQDYFSRLPEGFGIEVAPDGADEDEAAETEEPAEAGASAEGGDTSGDDSDQ